jgi:hypothetical protein
MSADIKADASRLLLQAERRRSLTRTALITAAKRAERAYRQFREASASLGSEQSVKFFPFVDIASEALEAEAGYFDALQAAFKSAVLAHEAEQLVDHLQSADAAPPS